MRIVLVLLLGCHPAEKPAAPSPPEPTTTTSSDPTPPAPTSICDLPASNHEVYAFGPEGDALWSNLVGTYDVGCNGASFGLHVGAARVAIADDGVHLCEGGEDLGFEEADHLAVSVSCRDPVTHGTYTGICSFPAKWSLEGSQYGGAPGAWGWSIAFDDLGTITLALSRGESGFVYDALSCFDFPSTVVYEYGPSVPPELATLAAAPVHLAGVGGSPGADVAFTADGRATVDFDPVDGVPDVDARWTGGEVVDEAEWLDGIPSDYVLYSDEDSYLLVLHGGAGRADGLTAWVDADGLLEVDAAGAELAR